MDSVRHHYLHDLTDTFETFDQSDEKTSPDNVQKFLTLDNFWQFWLFFLKNRHWHWHWQWHSPWKSNTRHLWPLRHWLHFRQLRTTIKHCKTCKCCPCHSRFISLWECSLVMFLTMHYAAIESNRELNKSLKVNALLLLILRPNMIILFLTRVKP